MKTLLLMTIFLMSGIWLSSCHCTSGEYRHGNLDVKITHCTCLQDSNGVDVSITDPCNGDIVHVKGAVTTTSGANVILTAFFAGIAAIVGAM